MLPILLPLTVERPSTLILGIIVIFLVLIVLLFVWFDYNSVVYLDEKFHEHYFPDTPQYVYKALMGINEWTFIRKPRLFRWLDRYGEVDIDDKHVMKKLSGNLYIDEQGNSWSLIKDPLTHFWIAKRRTGTPSNKKGLYNPYI